MSFSNVGRVWTVNSFSDYLKGLKKPDWVKGVCLHHTAFPDLNMRPKGFTIQHIENIRFGYVNNLKWKSGPHLFIDEDQIFGMTPLSEKGIHAVSFNSSTIGIEVLGDYDKETPLSGRGKECWETVAFATKEIYNWLGIKPNISNLYFHRDDPQTKKSCPGNLIKKEWVLDLMNKGHKLPEVSISVFPVIDFVTKNKGYSYNEAVSLLKKQKDLFFFGNDWLEGAYYDAQQKATVAPLSELSQIVHKTSCKC